MQVSEYRTILVINNRVVYAASHHVERRNWHCVMHRLTITVSAEITSLAERLRIHQPVVFFANVWVRTEKNTPVVRNQTIHMRNPIVSYDFSAKCYKFPKLPSAGGHCGSAWQGFILPEQSGELGSSGVGKTREATVTAAGGIRVSGHIPFRYVCLYRDVSGNGKCLYPQYLGLGSGRFQKE